MINRVQTVTPHTHIIGVPQHGHKNLALRMKVVRNCQQEEKLLPSFYTEGTTNELERNVAFTFRRG